MAFRVCDGLTVNEPVWLSGCFFFEKKKKFRKAAVYPELFWTAPGVKKKCVVMLKGLMPDWMF